MKRTSKTFFALLTLATLLLTPAVHASSRATKKIGVGIGLITEPLPSLLGYNLSYNIKNRFRVTAGYGTLSSSGTNFNIDIKTYGLNLKYFLMDWNFSPFIEGGASLLSGSVTGTGTVKNIAVSSTGIGYFAGGGIDWQTRIGFNFGLSYKLLFGRNSESVAVPGLHLGWFF